MDEGRDPNALARALVRIEAENRRLRRTLTGVALVALVPALLAARSPARVVEAERFVLRAPSGEERGEWRVGDDGQATLALRDPEGRERLALGVAADGRPAIDLRDARGLLRVRLLLARESSLNFYDTAAHLRAAFGVTSYGPTPVRPYGQNRRVPADISPDELFTGSWMQSPAAVSPKRVTSTEDDGPVFKLYDASGRPRLEVRVDRDLPSIFLHTPEGAIRHVALRKRSPAPETGTDLFSQE